MGLTGLMIWFKVGWFGFLREFGFGGCLADDMGLGKTVMVIALLEGQRLAHAEAGRRQPSLAVLPRSLVFNWMEEARRFAPELNVLDATGATRDLTRVQEHDLVLATYGTLRRDIAAIKDIEFDYVILDEAQAVKNPSTAASKSVRLLRGRHRLALSGTPIRQPPGRARASWSPKPRFLGSAALQGSRDRTPQRRAGKCDSGARRRQFILRATIERSDALRSGASRQSVRVEGPHGGLYDLRANYAIADGAHLGSESRRNPDARSLLRRQRRPATRNCGRTRATTVARVDVLLPR